jgi:hypothetical protein
MASKEFQLAIEHFEFADPDKVPALKDFAKTCRASTIVIDAARGSKLLEDAASGGKGRGEVFAPIMGRRKKLLADILRKYPDKNDSEIAVKLGKAIAEDNLSIGLEHEPNQTERIPGKRQLRRLVGKWRKALSQSAAQGRDKSGTEG